LAGILWIIWVKIGSSLIFYFVAINDDWRLEIGDCRSTKCAETYTRPGHRVPQRVISCQTSMFINIRMATIGKYRNVPVYSGKMSWYSVIFRHIPWYSGIFRDIPPYSVIFRHSGFSQRPQQCLTLVFKCL
jgi:hypothetical protein